MNKLILVIGILLSSIFSSYAPALGADTFLVTIKKGDSVSLLCIKYYSWFDPQMMTNLASRNPYIKNWQVLPVGQKIRFLSKEKMEQLVAKDKQNNAVITYLQPPVLVTKGTQNTPIPAKVNMLLTGMDRLQVGHGGRVEIMAPGPQIIRLSELSNLLVSSLIGDVAKKSFTAKFKLFLGKLWGKMLKWKHKRGANLHVETPTAIAGIRGTAYDMKVTKDKSTSIRVFEGQVEIYNPLQKMEESGITKKLEQPHEVQGPHEIEGPHPVSQEEWTKIVLRQYQEVLITSKGIGKARDFDYTRERQTEWVKWNEERDRILITQ